MKNNSLHTSKLHPAMLILGFFVIGFLIGGMVASMGVLVYQGLVSLTAENYAGYDITTDTGEVILVMVILELATGVLFVWLYFRFRDVVRRNLE